LKIVAMNMSWQYVFYAALQ